MMEPIDVNDVRVQTLLGLGTDATAEQIARLLDRHNGHLDNVAAALLDGNFEVDDSDTRGRQTTKAIAPALPPRRKQNSPVDNSRALVRVDNANDTGAPRAYDEDVELNKALALSLKDTGGGELGAGDGDEPPPLEPVGPVYGPQRDPRTTRGRRNDDAGLGVGFKGLDETTDHALRRALEASLNDGKNSLAADVYEELGVEEQVRTFDGRPTALRSSDPNSIFAPPILQALLSIPQLLNRLKEIRTRPGVEYADGGEGTSQDGMEGVERMLDGPWHDCEIVRELFAHAEHTQRAYVDIQPWAEKAGWAREDMADSPNGAAADLMHYLTRALNLSLPDGKQSLFLPRLHDPNSPTRPPPLSPPHAEISEHQEPLLYLVPLNTPSPVSETNNNLIDILESQVSADRVGFSSLPEALAFRVEGGGGRFGFPARVWMDRWVVEKRGFVEGVVLKRAREIEILLKGMEEEKQQLLRHEGRDTLVDLRVCIKHFETTASDGGDEKRAERNRRTLEKLKTILKDFEDRCEQIAKKSEELKTESAGLWNRPELMTIPYDLRAVVIHDGLLGRAHLFSYVRRADKWWKVVDATVSEVTEDTVLNDTAGVHLGAGVLVLVYAVPTTEAESHGIKWPRKDRLKSQKLDEPFFAQLSPETQARLAEYAQPVSQPVSDDEEEFIDADEMIVVAHETDEVVDDARDVPDDVSMDGVPAGVV
ncbi:hypothetical protein FRC06_010961 [Ceratobasidium sp. 370]|nr:hypothetical protein FRC06_010961 [Ceratobasidium sp. 370]